MFLIFLYYFYKFVYFMKFSCIPPFSFSLSLSLPLQQLFLFFSACTKKVIFVDEKLRNFSISISVIRRRAYRVFGVTSVVACGHPQRSRGYLG